MKFLALIIVVLTITYGEAQMYCMDCVQVNNASTRDYSFLCNGRNCDAFQWPLDYVYYYGDRIDCRNTYQSSRTQYCYYFGGQNRTSGNYKYIACNYTMPNCGRCLVSYNCQACYIGYGLYYDLSNPKEPVQKCRSCKDSIPGCVTCRYAQQCQQCEYPFILINGICYEKNGKTIAGKGGSDGALSPDDEISQTIEIFVIISTVLLVVLIGIAGYGLRLWVLKQRYQPLLQNHN